MPKCAAWLSGLRCRYLKFKPQDGVAVLARGRIDVYDARGEYQLLVEALEPQGQGALQFAFEQLKKKLAAEGLFEAARKRPLPRLPRRIGIVTSPHGAAIRGHYRDSFAPLSRDCTSALYPALVQGDGSVEEVVRAIEYFSHSGWPDVVILARGGGSLEDLWTFNEEPVARAIAACADAGDFGCRPRDGLHHRRFRRRSARAHALGRGRAGGLHARGSARPCQPLRAQAGASVALPSGHGWRAACISRASSAPPACCIAALDGWQQRIDDLDVSPAGPHERTLVGSAAATGRMDGAPAEPGLAVKIGGRTPARGCGRRGSECN